MSQLKPTGNKILAIRKPRKEFTDGGIFIPDFVNNDILPNKDIDYATVVASGPGIRNKKTNRLTPVEVKKGDTIIFNPHKCMEVKMSGKTYILTRETEIFGVVE